MTICSPLCSPRYTPSSMSSPGGFAHRGSLRASMSLPLPPQVLLQIMESSGPWFLVRWAFAQRREAKTPALPGSCVTWYLPPLILVHVGVVQATQITPPHPYPPLVVTIPSPLVDEVWSLALEVGVMRACSCHVRGLSDCKTKGRLVCTRIRSVDNHDTIFSQYRYEVIPGENFINEKKRDASYDTMRLFAVKDQDIKHWKCVIFCLFNFITYMITYEEIQDNIDMPKIQHHIYKEVCCCGVYYQMPLGVTSMCYLCKKMEDNEAKRFF